MLDAHQLAYTATKVWATYWARLVVSVFILYFLIAASGSAHTLSDAASHMSLPVATRYGACCEVGSLTDYDCDFARDVSRAVVFLSFIFVLWVPAGKRRSLQRIIGETVVLAAVPITVNLGFAFWLSHRG